MKATRIDRFRASMPANAAARERRVHGAMTMIPNRGRRRLQNRIRQKRAGVIESDKGEGCDSASPERIPSLQF